MWEVIFVRHAPDSQLHIKINEFLSSLGGKIDRSVASVLKE